MTWNATADTEHSETKEERKKLRSLRPRAMFSKFIDENQKEWDLYLPVLPIVPL